MEMRVKCPGCGKEIRIPPEYAGKPGKCSACGRPFRAPSPTAPPQPEPPAGGPGADMPCPRCGARLATANLNPGEVAQCQSCGHLHQIPLPPAPTDVPLDDHPPAMPKPEFAGTDWTVLLLEPGQWSEWLHELRPELGLAVAEGAEIPRTYELPRDHDDLPEPGDWDTAGLVRQGERPQARQGLAHLPTRAAAESCASRLRAAGLRVALMPRTESRWLPPGLGVASLRWGEGRLTVHGIHGAADFALPLECIVGVHLSRIVTLKTEIKARYDVRPSESGRDPLSALSDTYMLFHTGHSLGAAATLAGDGGASPLLRTAIDVGLSAVGLSSAFARRAALQDTVESTVVADLISADPLCCLRIIPEVLDPTTLGAAKTSSAGRNIRVLLDMLRPLLPNACWLMGPDSVEAPTPGSPPREALPTSWQPLRARDIVEFVARSEWLLNLACAPP